MSSELESSGLLVIVGDADGIPVDDEHKAFKFGLRTVPTNSKVFLSRFMIMRKM